MTKTKEVRWVGQEHPYGCGAACLAMLTGKTYDDVIDELYGLHNFNREGMQENRIDAVLAGWGYAVARRYMGAYYSWYPQPFAEQHLCVVYHNNVYHYVVMLENGIILDPATTHDIPRSIASYDEFINIAAVVKFK